ncbi:thiamine pyrophosphate-dependent enzyme [Gulosibacter molinativorax]|uniref:Acetolactate synthase n=1 Tax=Gulosibacter molinativorax TaxID=256821 RepID=A0ABT7C6D8_9MICO|nr:thiamine pyrophosphate-dependent enzyme [Gulosibacter molinativorax]MDJ1370757.1 acetolactate synthase [Gulosibacter molinativorax]QUY63216.1 Acetolactate synthase large subunit [Gulosibacter molinativorax]
MTNSRSVGNLIVETLANHGVERVYSVPGESFLDVLDGLYDSSINNVVCRQEGGVGFMALAEGRLTGIPGIAMVTRGPGASNFFIAAHCAYQDATPLVCFIGLVPIADRRRESFQEFSIDSWFGSTVKRVLTVENADQAGDIVAEAMHVAVSGRPGPVVVGLPEDLLRGLTEVPAPAPRAVANPAPSRADLESLKERILAAEKPLLLAGGDAFFGETGRKLADWALENHIPVAGDWRNYDVVPNNHPAYVGWPGYGRRESIVEAIKEADLFIGLGAVRGDVMSEGYTVGFDAETVLVSTDAQLLQHSGRVDQFIASTPANFVAELAELGDVRGNRSGERVAELRASHERFTQVTEHETPAEGVDLELVFDELEQQLGDERVVTYGAGNATIWGHRQLTHNVPNSLVGSRNGAMGMAVPAAVAASLVFPERRAVAVCGDGDFFMNGQEVATLVAQGSRALFVVVDNSKYATIVEHQERWYPGRPSGTDMVNPDFTTWIESFGGRGARLESNENIAETVAELLEFDGPALLHLVIDSATPSPSGVGF